MENKTSFQSRPHILAFGEVLFDYLPTGKYLGGAPCNFAFHARQCGAEVALYSRVGADELGRVARTALLKAGISGQWLQTDAIRATGSVNVVLGEKGEPCYDITSDAAWDAIAAPSEIDSEALRNAGIDALVFGTLAQRSLCSREALIALRRVLPDVPVLYDVNLRAPHTPLDIVRATLPGVTLLKLNEAESDVFAGMLGVARHDIAAMRARLHDEYGIGQLLVSMGPAGCMLASEAGVFSQPAAPAKVLSTVGAGDSMAAVFLCGWLRQVPSTRLLELANKVAGWVTTQEGATPELPQDLRDEIHIIMQL